MNKSKSNAERRAEIARLEAEIEKVTVRNAWRRAEIARLEAATTEIKMRLLNGLNRMTATMH